MSDELKPCKRCGGKAVRVIDDSEHEYDWDWFVQCRTCYERTGAYDSIDKAVAAWNARADDVPETTVDNAQADSRERLEADMRALMRKLYEIGYTDARANHGTLYKFDIRHPGTDFNPERGKRFIELLDRQAAITRAEVFEDGEYDCMTCAAKAELRQRVDSLTAERDDLRRITKELEERNGELLEGRAHWIDQAVSIYRRFYPHNEYAVPADVCSMVIAKIDELTAERDELRDIIDHMPKTEAECEACQEAHDRLMFNAKVDMDRLRDKLAEKQHVCDVQRDSFLKLEREYRELQDVCGELERTVENLRGD